MKKLAPLYDVGLPAAVTLHLSIRFPALLSFVFTIVAYESKRHDLPGPDWHDGIG